MKKRIFLRTYAVPIILAISLAIKLVIGSSDFKILIGFFFVFAVLSRTLLTDRRYITDYHFTSDSLHINYITQFFYSGSLKFKTPAILGVEFVKRAQLFFWSPTLELNANGVWIEFHITTKELHKKIQSDFSSSNPMVKNVIHR